MEPFIKANESLLDIVEWQLRFPRLVAGFSTRQGGQSKGAFSSLNTGFHVHDSEKDVNSNRAKIANALHFPIKSWVGSKQTHQSTILHVKSGQKGLGAADYSSALPSVDGFYTSESGILQTLCFADCVPIYFLAPSRELIGIVHAGWQGTAAGITSKLVEIWKNKEGVDLSEIEVVIGPSIGPECYCVDRKVISAMENILEEETKTIYNQITDSQYQLDLKMANQLILQHAGIKPSQITVSTFCTCCDEQLFFSHRRDHGKAGRMLGYIGWKEDLHQ